ncbi:hypothetical protein JCM8097_007223 [Rhodosporidiobolus ruineniae]
MPDHISVTFLGTAAGKPSQTRNVSSLVVKLDSKLWVFDAGEGTQHQLMDPRCKLQMSKISRIFVTHMHGDHINGLPGLLCTISAGEGSVLPGQEDPRLAESKEIPPTHIYGPRGLRLFLRTALALSYSVLTGPYAVHELLWPDEEPSATCVEGELHPSEREGRDVRMGKEGDWREFVTEEEGGGVRVSAAPIEHSVRCLGYLLTESARPLPLTPSLYVPHLRHPLNAAALAAPPYSFKNPLQLLSVLQTAREPITLEDGTVLRPPGMDPKGGRRIAVLGDAFDATPMLPLIRSSSSSTAAPGGIDESVRRLFGDGEGEGEAGQGGEDYLDLLIHESTNAFLPTLDESQAPSSSPSSSNPSKPDLTLEAVTALARSHGHSTPQVAGSFARQARARRLVLNHLSTKYPDPTSHRLVPLPAEEGEERDKVRQTRDKWSKMLSEIERQAGEALGGAEGLDGEAEGEAWRVRTARDFWEVEVVRRDKLGGAGGGAEAKAKKAKGGEGGKGKKQ